MFKLFATILLPALGMLVGLIMLTAKLALIAAVVYFIYTILRPKPRAEEAMEADVEEELEIVVEEAPEAERE